MATGRLTLSTVGIKSPLDVADAAPASTSPTPPSAPTRPAPKARSSSTRRSGRHRSAGERRPAADAPGHEPFYGCGPRVQTSIALDADHARLLDELARAGHVTVNALAVAALQAGLPAHSPDALTAIVDERVRSVGHSRVERNLRIPVQLRTRIDELVAAARDRVPRVKRADLVNAALGRGLPADAQQAATLVADFTRRLEAAAAA